MTPATWPRDRTLDERLLVVERRDGHAHETRIGKLTSHVRAGDLLIVNDAGTLPASFRSDEGEVRLVEAPFKGMARAVLFDDNDWRTPTELRRPPKAHARGSFLTLHERMLVEIVDVSPISPRLVTLRFHATHEALYRFIFEHGAPVQYSYLRAPLELWDIETPFAGAPWAVEMPCAGRVLVASLRDELESMGVHIERLTHGAGLSSTGDEAIDRALPLDERYMIPARTIEAIHQAKREDKRIIAIGTTVARALEGAMHDHGELRTGESTTAYKLDAMSPLRIVDALFTGVHERGTSHFELMRAFVDDAKLDHALALAEERGFRTHEFGDSFLLI